MTDYTCYKCKKKGNKLFSTHWNFGKNKGKRMHLWCNSMTRLYIIVFIIAMVLYSLQFLA